jgi:biotin carboxyl carrier protein
MEFRLTYLNEAYVISLNKEGGEFITTLGKDKFKIKDLVIEDNLICFKINGAQRVIYYAQADEKKFIAHNGEYYLIELEKPNKISQGRDSIEQGNSVASPMPGLMIKLLVAVGDKVVSGVTMAVVEAMKMQNELRAPCDGIVKKINFKEGDQVDAFQPIVELEELQQTQ